LGLIGRWVLVSLFIFLSYVSVAQTPGMDSARINVIKAGMVNGFTAYTTWPDMDNEIPFVIGVMGHDKLFIPALKRFFEKKPVFGGRAINIREIIADDAVKCHVVVILGDANQYAANILSQVANRPILTISDRENFAQSGGHVNFYNQNNKLRFEVNWQSTTNSKLKVSSRLLRLARVVGKPK